ncbi:hypothetical protein [Clostridium tetani]|uniref:hypothetical protein n=2 Tax=Clostridium tetani TaxID=1513 RepID=UPI0010263898|nr:hypothetical protein [Clostridium tetani]RXM71660.1 hypothetical protein DP139_03365 [Clostridium tetani]BDR85076.1 hypothetical protein K254310026_24870 [Clostridium tetani]
MYFIRDRNIPLMAEKRGDEPKKIIKLNNFIKKATSNKMCDFWNTKDDLALKLLVALNKQFNKKQRPGWIRADNVDFMEISNELMKLSQENSSLREENENLKSKLVMKKPVINLEINNEEELRLDYPKKYNSVKHQFRLLSCEEVPRELKKYVTEEEIDDLKEAEKLEMPVNLIKKAEKEYSKWYLLGAALAMSSLLNYNNFGSLNFKPVKLASLYNNRNSWLENNIITVKINSLIYTRQIYLDEKYRIIPLELGSFNAKVSIICEEYEKKLEYEIPTLVKEI